jgi:hypothetical protein
MRSAPGLLIVVSFFAGLAAVERPVHAGDATPAACIAAHNNSQTLRHQHKLQEARAQLLICSAAGCPGAVQAECIKGVGEVNAAIPTVVFDAKDADGNDLPAVKVTIDGQTTAADLDGTALWLNPGDHVFTFTATGHPVVEKHFVMLEGEKDRRERVVFAAPTVAVIPQPAPSPGLPPMISSSSEPAPVTKSPDRGLKTRRILAIVAASVGVVGLGVGIAYGLQSMSKHDDASKGCPDPQCSNSNDVTLWNQAISAGDVATAGFVIGGVGLAAGAVLWFTARSGSGEAHAPVSAQVGVGPRMLAVSGSW